MGRSIPRDTILEDTDIVIPIMGATGAGKSTFINRLLGKDLLEVGHKLSSCTVNLRPVIYEHRLNTPSLRGRRGIIVDTPGLDDTYVGDVEILTRIAGWLERSYRKQMVLGVLYLHDVSQDRFSGTARRNLEMFNHLCGDAALDKVILAITKGGRLAPDNVKRREEELKSVHWKSMIDKRSVVRQFFGTTKSAQDIINIFLERASRRQREQIMKLHIQIQAELVDNRKFIPQTEAGKQLRYTLQEVLALQKQMISLESDLAQGGDPEAEAKLREAEEKMRKMEDQVKALKVSLSNRIGRKLKKLLGI
ncbi:hypothetical protein NLJ89_g728 [Agrocybe chaxingu]|uniref:AIG1-type G domain-containing protein n=1 Tax=Agrocybe chaxingu TaxID=84603 RepID=A0A9W8TEL7_9AGAR|nr:hypothetical protein NLJ89_g728 [Agrocybe chaxingu]